MIGFSNSGTAGYRHLMYAVLYRDLINWVRYPINATGVIIGQFVFFALIFFGGQAVAGPAFSGSIEALIIGYFLWTLSGQSYQGVVNIITREASWGTLERHFISPFGFKQVLLAKVAARVLRVTLLSVIVLLLMMILTRTWLELHLLTVVPILALTVLSIIGFGFAMGGLAVLYKQIDSVTDLFNFAIAGFIGAPLLDIVWLRALPLVQGSAMLQQAIIDGIHIWQFDLVSIGILGAVSLGYFIIGFVLFHLSQRRARNLGVLGDY